MTIMVGTSGAQTVESQAPATAAEVAVWAPIPTELVDCKIPEPSKMGKSGKRKNERSLNNKGNRARSHLVNILVCLTLVSTALLVLVIGYTGSLHFVEKSIEEINNKLAEAEDISSVELLVRRTMDTLMQEALPLHLVETHEECLIRGAYTAYTCALPSDYTYYPETRKQTLTWVEDSCEKIFAPQAQQLRPDLQLAIVWQHWRQEVEGLLQLMKYKLGNARSWLRLKLGKTSPVQRSSSQYTTGYDTTDHKSIPIRQLKPSSIYIECQASRCHLSYLPPTGGFCQDPSIEKEPPITMERRLEKLQATRANFKYTLPTLALIALFIELLERGLSLVLFINYALKFKRLPPPALSLKTFIGIPWRRIWRNLDDLDKRMIVSQILSISGDLFSFLMHHYGYGSPVVVYNGLIVVGYTVIHAFIVHFCSGGPSPLTLRQVLIDIQILGHLVLEYIQEHDGLSIYGHVPTTKDTAKPAPSPLKAKEPAPNVRIISPTTTFLEDLEEEVRLWRISVRLAPPNGRAPKVNELQTDDHHQPASEPAVYEDVDLDSDSSSDTSWSVV